jgi:hypothetical protein
MPSLRHRLSNIPSLILFVMFFKSNKSVIKHPMFYNIIELMNCYQGMHTKMPIQNQLVFAAINIIIYKDKYVN